MAASQLTGLTFREVDADGNPLVGGLVYAFQAGAHAVPLDTFTDYAGGTPNQNPVVLDARGEAQIWMGANPYYFEVKTAAGALIRTVDNVNQPSAGTVAFGSSESFAASASPWTVSDVAATRIWKIEIDGRGFRLNNFTITNGGRTATPTFSLVGMNLVDIFYI